VNGSGTLLDGGLELLPRYVASFEDDRAVDLDGRELGQRAILWRRPKDAFLTISTSKA
jgi:hypothetical protein